MQRASSGAPYVPAMSDPSDESITHVFDQTNGVIERADGESDGTAASDTASAGDRTGDDAAGPLADEDAAAAPAATSGSGASSASSSSTASTASSSASTTDDAAADDRSSEPRPATLRGDRSSEAGADYAPTSDLPLPGDGGRGADEGAEHTYAVDAGGTATDEGATRPAEDSGSYSDAPEVAALSATDDGRDETTTRAERSDAPVDDASRSGRLADAYETGPTREAAVAGGSSATAAVAATSASAGGGGGAESRASSGPSDDDSIGHVFDQTNGVIDGLDGDSDGTELSDEESAADREGLNEPNPVGQQDAWHDDHYGESDGRDPNP